MLITFQIKTPSPRNSAREPHVLHAIAIRATDMTKGIRDRPIATNSATINDIPKEPLRYLRRKQEMSMNIS